MANIKIHNFRSAGSELFNDSESYLNDLVDPELSATQGGTSWGCIGGALLFSLANYDKVNVAYTEAKRGWIAGWNRR